MAGDDRNDATWLQRLKAANAAGCYRTEAAEDEQMPFPWPHHTCGDCPFGTQNICLVHEVPRPAKAHTWRYFDRPHRADARTVIRRRHWEVLRTLE